MSKANAPTQSDIESIIRVNLIVASDRMDTRKLSKKIAAEIYECFSEALHFNQLSGAEAERLALLVEEMGEAQQSIGKILRHGYESRHPDGGPTNRETLERELGDVEFAGGMLKNNQDLNSESVENFKRMKGYRVYQYLHHHEEFVEIT